METEASEVVMAVAEAMRRSMDEEIENTVNELEDKKRIEIEDLKRQAFIN